MVYDIIKTFPQWEGFVLWVSLQLQIISVTPLIPFDSTVRLAILLLNFYLR